MKTPTWRKFCNSLILDEKKEAEILDEQPMRKFCNSLILDKKKEAEILDKDKRVKAKNLQEVLVDNPFILQTLPSKIEDDSQLMTSHIEIID